jgi:hypothetical protein
MSFSVMPDLPMPKRLRAGRLDPASRDPRKHWIPAFAGMTSFLKTVLYGQAQISSTMAIIERGYKIRLRLMVS